MRRVGFSFCTDPAPFDWIRDADTDWRRLVTFGPPRFGAYARLRFVPDPTAADQREGDVAAPPDHPGDFALGCTALRALAAFAVTPEELYLALWTGFSEVLPESVRDAPLISVPQRAFAMLRGSIDDLEQLPITLGVDHLTRPPAFAWPADRSWCFASDVDPHWAGVGGSTAAVAALVADPDLDVVPADPRAEQPAYR